MTQLSYVGSLFEQSLVTVAAQFLLASSGAVARYELHCTPTTATVTRLIFLKQNQGLSLGSMVDELIDHILKL